MRASEAVVKQRRGAGFHGETPCSLQHPLPAWRRLCPAAGWRSRGRRERPRGAGIGESPVSAARAAIEAARTSIIQAQTRVEASRATERRILADIDDSELKAPAMAAFSIASLSREVPPPVAGY